MRHYLVTGGAGFIGSHLCDALLAEGCRVSVIDDLSTGQPDNLDPRVALIIGDIRDRVLVRSMMEDVDGCFHLAAVASVQKSVEDWAGCHAVNLTGAVNVFDAARGVRGRAPVPVVYASSAAVYGDNAMTPLSERAEARPLTAYGADKLGCEFHARVASVVHGVPTTGFRFFNVYGPRQDPHSPYSGVISIFADRLKAGAPLTVFGDGEQCRDFVYAGDVARALISGMKRVSTRHEVFNVCTGRAVSLNQLIVTMASIMGVRSEVKRRPPRKGDIRLSVGDPSRALRSLRFEAAVDLREGLRRMLPETEAAAAAETETETDAAAAA